MQIIKFKNNLVIVFFIVISLFVIINSCNCNKNKKKIDVSHIEIEIIIHRFEQELFNLPINNFEEEAIKLKNKYPVFFKLYIEDILRLRRSNSIKNLKLFITNEYIKGLYDTCQSKYDIISDIKSDLKNALRYYKYHFHEEKIPTIYTFISEFGYGVITADSILGIGLDMFLGENYKYYPSIGLPEYIIKKLKKEFIVPSCITALLQKKYEMDINENLLLNKMVYHGKILYCLDQILPDVPDYIKIGYTKEQMKWCEKNEANIWTYVLDRDLLYETDILKYQKYINDGPTTPGMPPESPGNIGSFVGWQIIRKFIAENPDVSLIKLMEDKNYTGQNILNQSKYKPKKSIL